MKKLIFILCFLPLFVSGQTTYKILADSTILRSVGTATNEFVLRNSTKDTTVSVLYNNGNGVTQFKKVRNIRLNDSTYVIKIGSTVIGDTIKILSSFSGGSGGIDTIYYPRTFQQFKNQMSAHTLIEGADYLMTDFTTIYDQPDFWANGTPKDTVVTKTASAESLVFHANSDSTFDNYVSSIDYPTDKIKFDFTFTVTEVMGAPAKGRISYREDEKGNIADYDWRNVVYLRYESSTGSGVFNSWKDNGEASAEYPTFGLYQYSFGNVFTGYCTAYTLLSQQFLLPNLIFQGTAIKNKFDVVYNSTFVGDCNENTIGDGSYNVTADAGYYYNISGHQMQGVYFQGNAENNYFDDAIINCTFGANCNMNSIWDEMTNVTTGTDFKRTIQYGTWSNSTVGDTFVDAIIYGITDSIIAGNGCSKIDLKSVTKVTLGNHNSNIKIGGSIPLSSLSSATVRSNITIGDNNYSVSFGGAKNITASNDFNGISSVDFSGAIDGSGWVNFITVALHPELYTTYSKQIIKASDGNVYTRYFNGATDVITIIN